MAMLLLHLSDIHLDSESARFSSRAKSLVSAALSPLLKYSHIHLVISGDLANKSASEDFAFVRSFLKEMVSEIVGRVAIKPILVLVPGNHDADFSGDQAIRDILVTTLRQNAGKVAEVVVSQIAEVLQPFFALQRELMPGVVQAEPWYATFEPGDGSGINYLLLNSPVVSTIKEEVGKLYFPIELVPAPPEGRTIVLMHHPFGWFMPDNAREIAQRMPSLGQLVLMGHEHVSVGHLVRDIYDGTSVFYLRANVLREPSDPRESAFQTIEIDLESGFTPRSYRWDGKAYVQWEERTSKELIVWPENFSSKRLSISSEGLRILRAPGANYTHRRKANITLEDIFVWPNLRRQKDERTIHLTGVDNLYDSKLLVDSQDELPPIVVVKGGEQCGKSALARMICLHANKRGLVPLLLTASSVSSWRDKSLANRLTTSVDEFYGKALRGEFQQAEPKDRVLVIDDFDLNQVSEGYFEGLKLLRQQFGRVFLMLDYHPGMEVALTEFLSDENFVESEIFDLVPSTQAHRLEIIERWLEIGSPEDFDQGSSKLMAAKLLKVVDETLGRNLVPSLPVFVLIVLQRAETEQDLDTVVKSGSHGFLYESMIRQSLSSKVTAAGLVTTIAYLTAFAGVCDHRKADGLTDTDFADFHKRHCENFELLISQTKLLGQLVAAEILDDRAGVIRFRYPFLYYYFLAKWLGGIEEWNILEPRIDEMVGSIHTEKNANVLLFLAHLGKNSKIHDKILESAKSMFSAYGVGADIFSPMGVIANSMPQEIRSVMLVGKKHDQLEDRGEDEKRDETATKQLTAAAEARLKHRLDDALRMNAAFKTLQVLGQVLRNHAGEIEKPEKQDMAETCVVLGLRVLKFIYDTVEENGSELLIFRAEQLKAIRRQEVAEKNLKVARPEPTDGEIAEELASYLPGFITSVTVGTLIKIANAIGCEDLSPTIDSVLKRGGTRRLIRLATRLEHFSDFPDRDVIAFDEDFLSSADLLPNMVLRRFLVRRFHLFPVRDELKKRVLEKFNISAKPFLLLPQKGAGIRQ